MTVADLILVTVVVLLWLGLVALALRGWRRRGRAQAQLLGDFPAVPGELGEPLLGPTTGVYVGSTLAPRWATRVAVGDVGDRAAVEFSRYRQGILLRRAGASSIWIPDEAITAVRTEHGLAGKVMTRDGVLVIRWTLPSGAELDSGLRADDKSSYPEWTAPYRAITEATFAEFHRTSEPAKAGRRQISPEQISPEQTSPEQTSTEQTSPEQTSTDVTKD